MPAQENIGIIRECLHAISGKPKPTAVVHHYVAASDEALRRHILHYETAFPRFAWVAHDMLALGKCVLVHLCMCGTHAGDLWSLPPINMHIAPPLRPTHNGDFTGLAPTGREVILPIAALFRVNEGRIVEHRMHYDACNLLGQLGLSRAWTYRLAEHCERHYRRIPLWRSIAQVKHD